VAFDVTSTHERLKNQIQNDSVDFIAKKKGHVQLPNVQNFCSGCMTLRMSSAEQPTQDE